MYPTECRFPQNSKKRQEGLLQWRMQRNRGKQQKGKTRDLFKHTGDIKGTFLAKMGTIKDRNGKDLIEADEIKKRWQEYSEELYKKGLNNHHGVVTHLEPDIFECEIKWALGSTAACKASGGGRTPAKLFQILKDDSIKVLQSICQRVWKTQQWPQDWKKSIFTPVPDTGCTKECINSWNNCAHSPL